MDINGLAAEINRQLALYANQTDEKVQETAKKIAEEGAQKLREVSPKRTGRYASGWTFKKFKGSYVVHNKTHYRLTHLLEKSHALRNGGRSNPQPHIKPVERQMIEDFELELRRALTE